MSAGRVRTKKKACSSEQSPDSLPLRSSGRQVKKKAAEATDDDDDASEKKYRKCEKAGCTATCPVCFASAAERCAKNGYTSRWYHLSCGEHFCNECFDHYYRSHKDGYEKYTAWKRIWTSNGKSEPSPKAFMADQQLPYWVQCTKPECGKWRQLTKEIQLTPQIAKTYRCGMKLNNSTKTEGSDQCSMPEDLRVAEVSDHWWYSMLILPPLLKDSVAAPFLAAYYPDCVGMSPSCTSTNRLPGESNLVKLEHLKSVPNLTGKGHLQGSVPQIVSNTELSTLLFFFSLLQEALTPQKCIHHIIVRGLVRIRCVQEMERILYFMTRKGLINTGILSVSTDQYLLPKEYHNVSSCNNPCLATSHHLLNSKDRIGGRVWDDKTFTGVTVGRGAQIVNGCVNNPMALMCEQVGSLLWSCIIIMEKLLLEKIQEIYKAFIRESGIQFSELEEKVLQFHLSNLEYACGSNLSQVSARSWDHNEFFAQFAGDHTLLTVGYSTVIDKLSEGLDIRLNFPVQSIDYSGEEVQVTTADGTVWRTQKVLVTVPLALLQKNAIQFNPPLSEKKIKAINSLGAGVIEKIALQFPYRFWDSKIQGADFFGHVPPNSSQRGLFSVFYDMDPEVTYSICISCWSAGSVSKSVQTNALAFCFPSLTHINFTLITQEVPDPVKFFVTRWSKDPWLQMAYSFVKTGGSGEAYDIIAEDIQGTIFFAGEVSIFVTVDLRSLGNCL
uniref:Lysine demethylase 1B n=1 Tax=Pavo cristatus TaxID=9049 RepID=A0A8C9ETN3_PAVCR